MNKSSGKKFSDTADTETVVYLDGFAFCAIQTDSLEEIQSVFFVFYKKRADAGLGL
jgi:hypothetical protein